MHFESGIDNATYVNCITIESVMVLCTHLCALSNAEWGFGTGPLHNMSTWHLPPPSGRNLPVARVVVSSPKFLPSLEHVWVTGVIKKLNVGGRGFGTWSSCLALWPAIPPKQLNALPHISTMHNYAWLHMNIAWLCISMHCAHHRHSVHHIVSFFKHKERPIAINCVVPTDTGANAHHDIKMALSLW